MCGSVHVRKSETFLLRVMPGAVGLSCPSHARRLSMLSEAACTESVWSEKNSPGRRAVEPYTISAAQKPRSCYDRVLLRWRSSRVSGATEISALCRLAGTSCLFGRLRRTGGPVEGPCSKPPLTTRRSISRKRARLSAAATTRAEMTLLPENSVLSIS